MVFIDAVCTPVVDFEGKLGVGRQQQLAKQEESIIETTHITQEVPKVVSSARLDSQCRSYFKGIRKN